MQNSGRMKLAHTILKGDCKPCLFSGRLQPLSCGWENSIRVAKAIAAVIKWIVAAVKALIAAIAAGGWVAVVIIVVVALIAVVLCLCFGVLLESWKESSNWYTEYRSSNYNSTYSGHPYFSIIYVSSTGLEDRFTYHSQSAGRAGTGAINDFSGNLTWTHADASIANGILPISLSHVYNTNDLTTDIGYGYGWRLNYSQSLKKVELENRTETATYYQLTDGDGTRHYYKYSSANTYVNELDHDSTLTISGNTVTIVDKGGNKRIFDCDSAVENGRLTTVEDANGNQTLISYSSTMITNLQISSIQEKLSGQSAGQSLTLSYSENRLSSVASPDGRNVSYTYSLGDLTNVPYTEIKYEYTNSAWGDQLTSYDNTAITYDGMGNPTSYRGYTFGWRGKQLVSAGNGTDTITYEYNEDGLRQKKTVNNVDTDYFYNGSVLIGMLRGQSKFLFSYDANGNVVSVDFNGTEYYYLRNAQGDIVKLIDSTGATKVEYTYDTWGKKVSTTGDLADTLGLLQPFRYRGYVYDEETGLYYLQSRYYDPTTGRFVSADVMLSTGQGVLGHNCYAYCLGNPINYKDSNGMCSRFLFIKIDCCNPTCKDSKYYDPNTDFISCDDDRIKCYGYAMKYVGKYVGIQTSIYDNYIIDSGYHPGGEPKQYNLGDVANNFAKNVTNIAPGIDVQVVNKIEDAKDEDLVIAVRVTGFVFFGVDDYHFAVRLKNGMWADKQGGNAAKVGHIKNGNDGWGRYDSDTKYIIIRRK